MTEEEVQTKWCPFANVIESGKQGTTRARNRVVQLDPEGGTPILLADNLAGARCIGSHCMAWLETVQAEGVYETRDCHKPSGELNPPFSNCPEGFTVSSHDSDGCYVATKKTGETPAQGRCGLVGSRP